MEASMYLLSPGKVEVHGTDGRVFEGGISTPPKLSAVIGRRFHLLAWFADHGKFE